MRIRSRGPTAGLTTCRTRAGDPGAGDAGESGEDDMNNSVETTNEDVSDKSHVGQICNLPVSGILLGFGQITNLPHIKRRRLLSEASLK